MEVVENLSQDSTRQVFLCQKRKTDARVQWWQVAKKKQLKEEGKKERAQIMGKEQFDASHASHVEVERRLEWKGFFQRDGGQR